MNGITFGNYHSSHDFALVLNSKKIGVPQPKVYKVPIDSADGELDLTEFFGDVKYGNRELEFRFIKIYGNFIEVFSTIQGAIHGRKMKIILDEDPNYFYYGRIRVDQWESNATTGIVTVKCDCDPYKLKHDLTQYSGSIGGAGSTSIVCTNSRKKVIPKITVSASTTLGFKGNTYSVNAGTWQLTNIVFEQGQNVLTIMGASGTAYAIEYQEGEI